MVKNAQVLYWFSLRIDVNDIKVPQKSFLTGLNYLNS